jgi:hypothetical protein
VSPPPRPLRTQRATFTALRSSLTNAPCGNARRQGISPPPLDDSPAQGPYLLPGPRTPVAFATHYRLSLGLRFAPSSPPVTPLGSQPPFSVGQSWNPYPPHYRVAFASSRSFTCYAFPRTYAWATRTSSRWPRAYQAYHVPQVVPTNGVRAPLYTGGDYTCVGQPLKLPEPAPHPILGLEPLSRLSSALVTMRNTKALLTLPLPVIPRSRSRVRLTVPTPAVCLRPHRYQ